MIIKSMSRKTGDFIQLLSYINKGKERENTAIFHNLRTDPDDINIIAQEFSENARYSPQRKNGVICYHEILSFSGEIFDHIPPDKGARGFKISPEILEDLAQEYLRLRAPNALGYAKLHRDTDHPHIHFCISGNQIKQQTKNRLSRAQFEQVKNQLRAYGIQKYPEFSRISLSSIQAPQKKGGNRSVSPPRHKPGQAIKQELAQKILGIFSESKSLSQTLSRLSDSGIDVYGRGKDAFYGVISQGKKYRLSTLKIKEPIKQRIKIWERTEKRFHQLEAITQEREKTRGIARL